LLREFGNAVGELVDRLEPFVDLRSFVGEELVDNGDQCLRAGDIFVENARATLVENGAFGSLEDSVIGGIAFVELALDFFEKIVLFVFGLSVAVGQMIEIDECAIDNDGRAGPLDPVFGDESEFGIGALATLGKQSLEGAADGAFVVDIELAELVQSFVVGLDGGVRRLEG